MEFILSGYGTNPTDTLALCSLEEDNTVRMQWMTSIDDPSFVCEGDGYFFTVTEAKDFAYVYLYERTLHGYRLSDQKLIEGGYLCHITYSSKNKALFGACYETGTVFSVRVQDSKFGELLYHEVQQSGDSELLTRAHCVLLNKNQTELVTVNIALDRICFYQITDGNLTLDRFLDLPKGIGPRHAEFSDDEKLLYVITEYSNEILIYKVTERDEMLQRISTLEVSYNGISNCSSLCFSRNRKFLYAANRGAQTITVFQVHTDGSLIRKKEFDCGGKHPRHMIVTRDGKYLAVCNQLSDNVVIFELDKVNGDPLNKITSFPFNAPSGIHEVFR